MLKSVSRIAPTFEEFTAGIAHKEYNVNLGLDILVDVTDFSSVSYEDLYRKIVEYQNRSDS